MFLVGRYRVVRVLAAGSLGLLYEGMDRDGSPVVVKSLVVSGGGDSIAALRDTILSRSVRHRGVLRPMDVLPLNGGLAIVSELVRGGSLADVVLREGALPPLRVAKGALLVSDALAALHRAGVVHGDVKPANILFRAGGAPVLADVGLACVMSDAGSQWPIVRGTVDYLGPECFGGCEPLPASDVYALGAVCWEALSGRRPFPAGTPGATMRAARAYRVPGVSRFVPEVPVCLEATIAASMAPRPEDRPTADELTAALDAAIPYCRAALAAATPDGGTAPWVREGSSSVRGAAPELPAGSTVRSTVGSRGERPSRWSSSHGGRRRLRRPPRWALGVGAFALMALVFVVGLTGRSRQARAAVSRQAGVEPATGIYGPLGLTGSRCGVEPAAAPVETLSANVSGTGCMVLSWANGVLTVRPPSGAQDRQRRYAMGRAGDELLVGEWQCQGTEAPALYRPSTGQVFEWAAWASPGHAIDPARTLDTGVVNGTATVVLGGAVPGSELTPSVGNQCDRITVRPRRASG